MNDKSAFGDSGLDLDVFIVGAGFGGLYMLHRCRRLGLRARAFERGSGVGGTWFWNRYPGARCDVESVQYSYQFDKELEQEWTWSERYSPQPELLRYANHVADRFGLRDGIELNCLVKSASFDEAGDFWRMTLEDSREVTAAFVVMATGCLSSPNKPNLPGLEDFQGAVYHTGDWPHEPVDFSGLRVGVIGTGSSAIQSIPLIAKQASELRVFQRTANYAVPAHNAALDPETVSAVKADYEALRERQRKSFSYIDGQWNTEKALSVSEAERKARFEEHWQTGGLTFSGAFSDIIQSHEANATAADFVRNKIRERVKDPAVAELLVPKNIIGGKRLCVDINYFETYNEPHVHLVDIRSNPIERITAQGLKLQDGSEHHFDNLVLATGFDAMTGTLLRIDIRGRQGRRLQDDWAAGPHTYLGLAMAGYPNLFTVTGPQSPSVFTNMLPSIEMHVEWISDCLAYLRDQGHRTLEATEEAEKDWVAHAQEMADATIRPDTDSWYLGANIEGKPRVFMPYIGGVPRYLAKCQDVVDKGYDGFRLA